MGIALETFLKIYPVLAHKIIREQRLFNALHIVLQSLAETEIYIHLPTRCELGQTTNFLDRYAPFSFLKIYN